MSQYKFKCDDSKCKKTFFSSNPSNCPLCNSEEFTLIGIKKNYNFLLITLILSFLSLLVYYGFLYEKVLKPVNNDFKSFLNSYYEMLQNKDINRFEEFYANNLNTWFNHENISLEEIIIKSNKYYNKYPFQVHDLNLDSLNIIKVNDNYILTYDLFYAYRKDSLEDWNKIDIKKSMMLNNQMKIVSVEESNKNEISLNNYIKKYSDSYVNVYFKKIPILTSNKIYTNRFNNKLFDFDKGEYIPPYIDSIAFLSQTVLLDRINQILYKPNHFRYGKLNEGLSYSDKLIENNMSWTELRNNGIPDTNVTGKKAESNFNYYFQRSSMNYFLGNYSDAFHDIEIAIKLGNQFSDNWFYFINPVYERAKINYMLENYSSAIEDVEIVLEYISKSNTDEYSKANLIEKLILKAEILNARENYSESCSVLFSIIELNQTFTISQLNDIKILYPNHSTLIIKVNDCFKDYCY